MVSEKNKKAAIIDAGLIVDWSKSPQKRVHIGSLFLDVLMGNIDNTTDLLLSFHIKNCSDSNQSSVCLFCDFHFQMYTCMLIEYRNETYNR